MDVKAYLDRIHYDGSLAPTAQTLEALQVAHLMAVPFENLSIHAGEPIVLEDDALFDKIVRRRRGGFCYELNGLFAALLRALGFRVTMLSAGVARGQGGFSPDFDHMALMVSLGRRWLADVGFGDTFRKPLLIEKADVQPQDGREYRIAGQGEYLVLMERKEGGQWERQYRFTLRPFQYADYTDRCHFQQTSPESHFTQQRVCSLATPDGRVTLNEGRFISTSLTGERQERAVSGEAEYAAILRRQFGIVMGE